MLIRRFPDTRGRRGGDVKELVANLLVTLSDRQQASKCSKRRWRMQMTIQCQCLSGCLCGMPSMEPFSEIETHKSYIFPVE